MPVSYKVERGSVLIEEIQGGISTGNTTGGTYIGARFFEVFSVLSSGKNAFAADAEFVAEGKTYSLGDVEAYLRAKCSELK